jgi:DNA-binding phage protein
MAAADARAVIARLRALLARGASLREAARQTGCSKSTLHRLAVRHGLPRRPRKRLTPRQIGTAERLVRAAHHTVARIAELLRVAKSTASQLRRRVLDDQAQASFRPRRLKTARVCPTCGQRIVQWPCVACQAGER